MQYILCIKNFYIFLRVVERASRYIRETKTKLMHYLFSVYFFSQSLHISGIFVAHHQVVYCTLYIQQLVRIVLFS
jgi:hypothetical protein